MSKWEIGRTQLTESKCLLSEITREMVMLRTEATIEASMVILWIETTTKRKANRRSMNPGEKFQSLFKMWCLLMTFIWDLSQEEALQMQSLWCGKCRRLPRSEQTDLYGLPGQKRHLTVSLDYLTDGSWECYVTAGVNINARSHILDITTKSLM